MQCSEGSSAEALKQRRDLFVACELAALGFVQGGIYFSALMRRQLVWFCIAMIHREQQSRGVVLAILWPSADALKGLV
ncbi:MAG: hypothetical protein WED13_00890 [Methyloceanibacter sp.]